MMHSRNTVAPSLLLPSLHATHAPYPPPHPPNPCRRATRDLPCPAPPLCLHIISISPRPSPPDDIDSLTPVSPFANPLPPLPLPPAAKIVTGSFSGFLRVYLPRERGYRPEDLLLEAELEGGPCLQLAAGRFTGWVGAGWGWVGAEGVPAAGGGMIRRVDGLECVGAELKGGRACSWRRGARGRGQSHGVGWAGQDEGGGGGGWGPWLPLTAGN